MGLYEGMVNFNSDNAIISCTDFIEHMHSLIDPSMIGRLVEFDNVYTNLAGSSLWWLADMRYCEELNITKVTLLYTKPISVENLTDFKRSFIPELHQLIDESIGNKSADKLLSSDELKCGVIESTYDDINEYNMMIGKDIFDVSIYNHHIPEINWWKNSINDIESSKFISIVLLVDDCARKFPSDEHWNISAK